MRRELTYAFTSLSIMSCAGRMASEALPDCRVGIAPGEVALQSVDGEEFLESNGTVVVDSRGYFYGAAVRGGGLIRWKPDGSVDTVIGRRGEGPGEFGQGLLLPYITIGDSIYVRDTRQHWVVYDDSLRFVRIAPLGPIRASSVAYTQFLPNGRIASTDPGRQFSHFDLVVTDRSGTNVDSFLPTNEPLEVRDLPRPSAYLTKQSQFLLAPTLGTGGYQFQIIDTLGEVRNSFSPDARWFDTTQRGQKVTVEGVRRFLFPAILRVVQDAEGLIWIWTGVPSSSKSRERYFRTPFERVPLVLPKLVSVRIDVFTPDFDEHVAWGEFSQDRGEFGTPLIDGRLIARRMDDSTGTRPVRVLRLSLKTDAGNSCTLAGPPAQ